jgi:hypothetical protein
MQTQELVESFQKKNKKKFLKDLVKSQIEFKNLKDLQKVYLLDLLRIFFFHDLIDVGLTVSETDILYTKIFSYLYSGDFGDGSNIKIYENPTQKSKNAISSLNIPHIRENHRLLNNLFSFYTNELKKQRLFKSDQTISKIVVFEAPPYRKKSNETSHFMFLGGTYYKAFLGKEIIKKKDKIKLEKEYHHIHFNSFLNAYSSWKVTQSTTKQSLESIKDDALERIDKIISSDIVYLDLFLMPMFMDSTIRKRWSTEREYFFYDKSIIVFLLEWTLQDFKARLGRQNEKLFSKNCLIALGMPLNTSIAIFEYYYSSNYLLEQYYENGGLQRNYTDISRLNSPTAFKKLVASGTTFPMFKSNVIGGNHLPDYNLVRNAFNLP